VHAAEPLSRRVGQLVRLVAEHGLPAVGGGETVVRDVPVEDAVVRGLQREAGALEPRVGGEREADGVLGVVEGDDRGARILCADALGGLRRVDHVGVVRVLVQRGVEGGGSGDAVDLDPRLGHGAERGGEPLVAVVVGRDGEDDEGVGGHAASLAGSVAASSQ
jgi:hypothetical protein